MNFILASFVGLWGLILMSGAACFAQKANEKIILSDDLQVIPLSENAFLHVSYITYPRFGRVSNNGLIYINGDEAIILDTPPDDKMTQELVEWLEASYPNIQLKGLVINHFHQDCLGGRDYLRTKNVNFYSHELTPELAKRDSIYVTPLTFSEKQYITVGSETIENRYFGEAHTRDNIITYIPSEKILFGGCMIKSLGAGKGNLDDANVGEWSKTITKIKKAYKNVTTVIPGHGDVGGTDLFDFTIRLFKDQ